VLKVPKVDKRPHVLKVPKEELEMAEHKEHKVH